MSGFLHLVGLTVFVSVFNQAVSTCPAGWIEHESICYFFSTNEKANWESSGEFCELFSSKLAEPRTASAASFVSTEAHKRNANFWLGISDIIREDKWIYSSDLATVSVDNWGGDDPSGNTESNCACTWLPYRSMWADDHCSTSFNFVCQREAEPPMIIG